MFMPKKNNLKYQLKRTHRGGNDARAVQLAGSGVKTAVISVPVRYIHSPSGIMDEEDFEKQRWMDNLKNEKRMLTLLRGLVYMLTPGSELVCMVSHNPISMGKDNRIQLQDLRRSKKAGKVR